MALNILKKRTEKLRKRNILNKNISFFYISLSEWVAMNCKKFGLHLRFIELMFCSRPMKNLIFSICECVFGCSISSKFVDEQKTYPENASRKRA